MRTERDTRMIELRLTCDACDKVTKYAGAERECSKIAYDDGWLHVERMPGRPWASFEEGIDVCSRVCLEKIAAQMVDYFYPVERIDFTS